MVCRGDIGNRVALVRSDLVSELRQFEAISGDSPYRSVDGGAVQIAEGEFVVGKNVLNHDETIVSDEVSIPPLMPVSGDAREFTRDGREERSGMVIEFTLGISVVLSTTSGYGLF